MGEPQNVTEVDRVARGSSLIIREANVHTVTIILADDNYWHSYQACVNTANTIRFDRGGTVKDKHAVFGNGSR